MKKREVAGDTRGADWPTQPPKKLKTEDMTLPAALFKVANNSGWRGDTSKMFSCTLCQYRTPDEEQIMEHFNSYQHKDILKHLFIFFPKHRVDFLHEYFLYVKEEMSMQQKNSDMPPIIDKFKGIGPEHYLHRIQAAHCRACEVLIPDVPELLMEHIKSLAHEENCKATFRSIKLNSYAVAKELFLDENVLQILKKYSKKQKPIKDIAACLAQVTSTDDILVTQEDEDDDDTSDEDAIADPEVPHNHNEDAIADAKADPKVPDNHNADTITDAKADPKVPDNHNADAITDAKADPEVPDNRNEDAMAEADLEVHDNRNEDAMAEADPEVPDNRNEDAIVEAKADPQVPGNRNEDSIADAKADPKVPGNRNEDSIADAKAAPKVPGNRNEDSIADAKAAPKVPGNRNEDVIVVAKVDPKVPVIHKQGPAHENKGHPGSNVPRPPMNIPRNMPSGNMVNPQLFPRFKMTVPSFPTYNSFRVRNDFQFAENFDLDEDDAFLVGSYGLEYTKKIGPTYVYQPEKKCTAPLPHQASKKKKKAKNPNKQQVINRPQSSGAAAKNPQKQQVINRPQSSGAAAKNPQKQQVINRPQSSGAAAKNPQKQQVINRPQSSGAAAKNPQKPQVINRPQSSGAAAKNPQKQQVINRPLSSGVPAGQNPQKPNPPAVSQPSSSKVTETRTQIGDMKKSGAAGENRGANEPTPPSQKLNTSNLSCPLEKPRILKNDRWRVSMIYMYSCSLCQYHTPDDNLIQSHVHSELHKQIQSHLGNFFSEQEVDFLHKYIMYKGRKTAMERKILNIQSFSDKLAGFGDEHFLHRVQAVHCQACDVLIPDIRSLYTLHIRSKCHQKKRKVMSKDIKHNSVAAAKQLFQDLEVCRLLKAYYLGRDPFQHLPVCSSQVSSTGKVQVDDADINDEDSIADDSDDSEVSAHETKGSHNKKLPPDEPKMIVPVTSSTTVNIGGTVQEEEEEEEDMATEAP